MERQDSGLDDCGLVAGLGTGLDETLRRMEQCFGGANIEYVDLLQSLIASAVCSHWMSETLMLVEGKDSEVRIARLDLRFHRRSGFPC